MVGNQSATTPNCAHFNASNSSSTSDKFAISTSCALFDFVVYTLAMGLFAALGVLGNVVSFIVLLRDRGRSATSFLLQALAVADTMVLLTAVPLYVAPSVYPYTGLLAGYYSTYMFTVSAVSVEWLIGCEYCFPKLPEPCCCSRHWSSSLTRHPSQPGSFRRTRHLTTKSNSTHRTH